MNSRSVLAAAVRDFRSSWKDLVLTDLAYKAIAFILLTPLVGVLFRVSVATSGKSVLADQDILLFFLGPAGWICFVIVGALWLGVSALELAALMGILAAARNGNRLGVLGALRFAAATAGPVILVTARLLALTLLTILPFLAAIGLTYLSLLGGHDINFYLNEKPPVFRVALAIAGITLAALVALLLRLVTSWFFALPAVLFEDVGVSEAMRSSRQRATRHRRTVLLWFFGWALATIILSALASSVVVFVGRLLVPRAIESLWLLVMAIGVTVIFWAGFNLVVSLIGTTTFATMLFNLYRELGGEGQTGLSRFRLGESSGSDTGRAMTRTRLIVAGTVGVIVALVVGGAAIETVRLEDDAQVTAHRGSSAAAPENTMAAIKRAIEDRADWVEIDVQETADGEVVVFHDSDFMRLAGVDLKIWDATMADLKEIDIGSWFAPRFKDERVPTLSEVLAECKGRIRVNIELKYYGHEKRLEPRVADIVEEQGMSAEIVVMSLKVGAIEKMKSLRPDWKVGLLMSVHAGRLERLDVDFLAVNAEFANRRFIRSAQDSDKEVFVWTVNDAASMSTMIGRGVNSIITDKPALARSVLKERAELSVPERLLLELAGLLGVVPRIRGL